MSDEVEAEDILKRIQLAENQASLNYVEAELFKGLVNLIQKQAKRIDILEEELRNVRGRVEYLEDNQYYS